MKKKNTVVVIVGARPQFIKAALLTRELKRTFRLKLIHTGQHYDHKMSEIFFSELDISRPDHDLGIGSGTHAQQTGEMLKAAEMTLSKEDPSCVVVFGDTNSTLAGALAASKLKIPVAHIESGLRSFRRSMPEEINRIITDHISSFLFCPTRNAVNNLKKEGIKKGVFYTGDVMFDALKMALPLVRKNKGILKPLGVKTGEYFLLTLHRDYNTDNKKGTSSLIDKLSKVEGDIVFPIHPRTRKTLKYYGLWSKLKKTPNIITVEPVGYIDFLTLLSNAKALFTDSGGAQKEAYLLKVPCLTLRDETEWIETLKGGANRLVGRYASKVKFIKAPSKIKCKWEAKVYGSGTAHLKTAAILRKLLQGVK
jgi:UDP-N-acetylglucosamine 2-epimerase